MSSLLQQIAADTRFYHALIHPGRRPPRGAGLVAGLVANRGLAMLALHRTAQLNACSRRRFGAMWLLTRPLRSVAKAYARVVCRSDILSETRFPGPVYLANAGYLMISARSIGGQTLIHDHCTFGFSLVDGNRDMATIGERVWIGPGCILIGGVTIGDGATILPGSVVSFSVPPQAVVQGNPARIVRTGFDNSALRASTRIVHELSVP